MRFDELPGIRGGLALPLDLLLAHASKKGLALIGLVFTEVEEYLGDEKNEINEILEKGMLHD